MSRSNRVVMAMSTLSICQGGNYKAPNGKQVSISQSLATAKSGTRLYLPSEGDELLAQAKAYPASGAMTMTVTNRTTLEAGRDWAQKSGSVACLNFASAKNPGGGFLTGAQAQEESLARASGLYLTLQTQLDFYKYHREQGTCLYSNRAIYSPNVPVFRDDQGQLLDSPWECAFITSAAVNKGAVLRNEPERENQIVPTMEERARMVLSIAIVNGCRTLVLGAWGCGVFRNDPPAIAGIFARVLAEDAFQGKFDHIDFAIYDPSPEKATLGAFQVRFG